MSLQPIVDLEAIDNLRALSPDDGDEFLREILSIFIADTPVRLAELNSTRISGDTASFVRAAHSIKGSSSNVGASELRALAEQLEHHAKHNGLTNVETHVAELEAAFDRVSAELNKLITG